MTMSIKIKYIKQSSSSAGRIVLLNGWMVRISKDPFSETIDIRNCDEIQKNNLEYITPTRLSIRGNSLLMNYGDFIKSMKNHVSIDRLESNPYPIAVRAIYNDTYVIERPPFKMSARISISKAFKVKTEAPILCDIWIPWTVSILNMNDSETHLPTLKIFFNDKPISSLDDNLANCWTPNVHGSGNICWGQTSLNFSDAIKDNLVNPLNVSQVYHYLINDYFNGGWNLDLGAGEIMNVCSQHIGKFTNNINTSKKLLAKAKNLNFKFKATNDNSRKSTKIKHCYNIWSLLELSEVLEAVSICKNNRYFAQNKISDLIKLNNSKDFDECSSIDNIYRYVVKNNLFDTDANASSPNWCLDIMFDQKSIIDKLLQMYSFENIINNSGSRYSSYSLSESATVQLIFDHQDQINSYIKSYLNNVATEVLNENFEEKDIIVQYQDIVKVSTQESVSI